MVTNTATPTPPWSPIGLAALTAAEGALPMLGHHRLVLRSIAKAVGVTHPAILKQFGSQNGFLAALAARQWERANERLQTVGDDVLSVAMADIGFAIEHPAEFRLMYDHEIWFCATSTHKVGSPREQLALRLLEEARNRNYLHVMATFQRDYDPLTVRLVAALVTGLSFEFVNERLYQGDVHQQLKHAKQLLQLALNQR